MQRQSLTIGLLARRAAVNVETVRYYQRRGLLAVPATPPGTVRRYSADSVQRLCFIKRAQQLGFTLDEIRQLLKLSEANRCSLACGVAERRLADIERRISDLAAMRQALRGLVGACRDNQKEALCPLVEAFAR